TLERLMQILQAYGAAPRRWPADERAAAAALMAEIARSGPPAAQAALAKARAVEDAVDNALDSVVADERHDVPDAAMARLAAAAAFPPSQQTRSLPGHGRPPPRGTDD